MYIPKYTYSASLVAVVSTRVNKGCMATPRSDSAIATIATALFGPSNKPYC